MIRFNKLQSNGHGQECVFYAHNNKGYKLYATKGEARRSLRRQRYLYKLGIAPKPYKMFSLKKSVRHSPNPGYTVSYRYGYCTELATMRSYNEKFPRYYEQIYSVLDRVGMYWEDAHHKNIGFINNKPVIIDFGDFFYCKCCDEQWEG